MNTQHKRRIKLRATHTAKSIQELYSPTKQTVTALKYPESREKALHESAPPTNKSVSEIIDSRIPKTRYGNATLLAALNIPTSLINNAPEFAHATVSSQILFGVIGISALIFAGWTIKQFIANGIFR